MRGHAFQSEMQLYSTIENFTPLQLHREAETIGLDRDILEDAWGWRELLQRGIDGSDCCDDSLEAGLAEYEDLPGAWPVVTGGYQVHEGGGGSWGRGWYWGRGNTSLEWWGGKVGTRTRRMRGRGASMSPGEGVGFVAGRDMHKNGKAERA